MVFLWSFSTKSTFVCLSKLQEILTFDLSQGKFIRIHFGTTGKLSSADIETCESVFFSQKFQLLYHNLGCP